MPAASSGARFTADKRSIEAHHANESKKVVEDPAGEPLAFEKCRLGFLAFRDVPVGLKHILLITIANTDLTAFDHGLAPIASGVHQLAKPLTIFFNKRFYLAHWRGSGSLQQIMAAPADRLFAGPAIEPFGAPAPIGYGPAKLPHQNRVTRLIQQIGLTP